MTEDPTIPDGRTQGARAPVERQRRWARAYRDGELVCGRVELTIGADTRLGLAPRERRRVAARFLDRLHPALRAELRDLVRQRGAAARRAADRMDAIVVVFDDPREGRRRIVGRLQPPQTRRADLRDIAFDLRETPQ